MNGPRELLIPANLLSVAMVLVRVTGEIEFANQAFGRQIGVPPADACGQPLRRFIVADDETVAEYMRTWSRTGSWSTGGLTLRTSNGRLTPCRVDGVRFAAAPDSPESILLRLVPRSDATEQFLRLNQHIADLTGEISRRKRLELERLDLLAREREARRQAEVANRLKDEFLATLSHELRTPLNAILGWTHLLQRGGFTDPSRALGVIERNARSQAQLIEDLLDVSRIVTGKFRLEPEPVDLSTVIAAAVDAVRPAVSNKQIRLDVEVDPSAIVYGDAARLEQVIWNLLTNAVKFTPRGGVVSLYARPAGADVEVVVADTGKGIAAEFLPRIFDRFTQADGSTTRQHGGLGLGLALVRAFVEAHGGTVAVESAGLDQGATFTVRLPMDMTSGSDDLPLPAPDAESDVRGLRVLVVDDDGDAGEIVGLILESAGAIPVVVGSARDAMRRIEIEMPDLLLSDLGMPDEDGFELIRALRALPEPAGGRMPAVAVSAYATPKDRADALAAGYDAHVGKPVAPDRLLHAVAQAAKVRAL